MRVLILSLLLLPSLAFAQDHRRAIENNLATVVPIEGVAGKPLAERMKELRVPALSYAVVEDGKIVLAAAYGFADVASKTPATTATLFQAASVSKPVAAMGAMELVERGKLALDVPVNTLLLSWHLPDNDLTAATPVTLRMLFSHSGGTTVHGFPGYAPGAPRPALTAVLDGKPPANTAAVVVDLAPNTKYRYSGGGITVAQLALEDQTGLAFPEFMRRTVLAPLGMSHSTYAQPLPPARRAAAATAYNPGASEVPGKWHVYPEMAAAGLWTTPSDLAKVIIEMQDALAGRPAKLLSIDAARHMLTPRFGSDGVGLGFFVEQRGAARYFTHNGSNEGFRSVLFGSMDGSRGAVVMVNADTGAPLMMAVLNTIAREYGWPGFAAAPLQRGTLSEDDAARFAGRFELAPGRVVQIRRASGGLELLDMAGGWVTLYPVAGGTLLRADRDLRYELCGAGSQPACPDGLENPSHIIVIQGGKRTPAKRLSSDAPLTAEELLAAGEIEKGKAALREQFRADPKSMPENRLNDSGFALATTGRPAQGLALLEINTELYPASANTWDSLAEVLALAGRTAEAIAATEEQLRRVDADPGASAEQKNFLRNMALQRLKKLRSR